MKAANVAQFFVLATGTQQGRVILSRGFFLRISILDGRKSRGDWIRTSDLLVPNQAHYQAVLHPVVGEAPRGSYLPVFASGFK